MKNFSVIVGFLVMIFSMAGRSAEFESELISVTVKGSGPDLLLIHGFASSSEVWSDVESHLGGKHRLHLVDINGFAGKQASGTKPESYITALRDEVLRYVETKNLNNPTLIGHSMGGLISLLVGSASQKSIGRIVVVDALPFYSLLFNPHATTEQVGPIATGMERQLLQMNEVQFEAQAKRSASILTKASDKVKLLLEWSRTSDRNAYAQMIREVMAYDGRTETIDIESPVIVIYAFDKKMPLSKGQLYQLYRDAYANIKNVQLVPIENSFHFIMWDQPKAFYDSLNKALSHSANTGSSS